LSPIVVEDTSSNISTQEKDASPAITLPIEATTNNEKFNFKSINHRWRSAAPHCDAAAASNICLPYSTSYVDKFSTIVENVIK